MNSLKIHRSYLFGAFVTILLMVIIVAQPNEQNSLERRVADLERRVAQLEQQKGIVPDSRPAQVNTNRGFENLENWRRLKVDMKESEVEAILGKPQRIDGGYVATWHYSNNRMRGSVSFIDGKLHSWSEPR